MYYVIVFHFDNFGISEFGVHFLLTQKTLIKHVN